MPYGRIRHWGYTEDEGKRRAWRVANEVMVDFGADRRVVGFDIQHASRFDMRGLLAEVRGKAN